MKKLIESIKKNVKVAKNCLLLLINLLILKKSERILLSYWDGKINKEELGQKIAIAEKRIQRTEDILRKEIEAVNSVDRRIPEDYKLSLKQVDFYLNELKEVVEAYKNDVLMKAVHI